MNTPSSHSSPTLSVLSPIADIPISTPPFSVSLAIPLSPPASDSHTSQDLSPSSQHVPELSPRDRSPSNRTLITPTALSAAAPQFQSRLLNTFIDIRQITSQLENSSLSVPDKPTTPPILSLAVDQQDRTPPAVQPISPLRTVSSPLIPIDPSSPQVQLPSPHPDIRSVVPNSTRSSVSLEDEQSELRTPNVYINGLPPNFPEEDLLEMTRKFGEVESVRTFTRHVCDKPSFKTIEAAEKCIETLRKYRNLHPSFSKQIHKIPGTVYSSPSFSSTVVSAGVRAPADSFKARMEQLRDMSSTNLYMEGLPLNIDERSLSALVNPYRIMSSRFFQTKLSNPPKTIAFVR
ncbi:uncharacterized protein FIBRA_01801 [Fibroporia radiculosa]|uniref:RRM domain-containing protein n=1 Tax=Fibroporia radiculosa TaxID=599839 RepID=J4H1F6_9APHY|nr:uncharacterized protein FIBRA_01801 [Fibroporia radiculosa]CCL99779.1 predicted protein [Fibroporia radiculosa]